MASFTDQIMQFNPYIPQLPIEAMKEVGMYKQQKYDEGVQKIQTYVDNVAGLEIIQDADKAYLQSKINDLSGKLKGVAAGDFSNFQLVNSVGGMVKQITKDPTIQTAVSSTALYKKGLQGIADARQEGKSSPSNEYVFNLDAAAWLNSKTPGTPFKGSYKPYRDAKKNAIEIVKAITKSSDITNDDVTVKDGKIVLSNALIKRQIAGVSPAQIKQALMVGLTPADFEQLEIDGRYNYANADEDKFRTSIDDSFKEKKDFYTKKKSLLEERMKSATNSPLQKMALQDKIDELDKTIDGLSAEYQSVTNALEAKNFEAAKARLFTNNFINGFGAAFSYSEVSETKEKNPEVEVALEKAKIEQDWRIHVDELKFKYKDLEERVKERLAKEAKEGKSTNLIIGGGLPYVSPQSEVPQISTLRVAEDTEVLRQSLQTSDANWLNNSAFKGKDAAWLEQQRAIWKSRPSGVSGDLAAYLKQTEKARRDVEANQRMILDIEKETDRQVGTIESIIPQNLKNIKTALQNPDGSRTTYTSADLANFNQKLARYHIVEQPITTGPYTPPARHIWEDVKAKNELSDKEFKLYKLYKDWFYGKPLNPLEEGTMSNMKNVRLEVNNKSKDLFEKREAFTQSELEKKITQAQGTTYTMNTVAEADKTFWSGIVAGYADIADTQKGKLPNNKAWNSETARDIAVDPRAVYRVTVVERGPYNEEKYIVSATGTKGNVTFEMTPEQKTALLGREALISSPEIQAAQPYLQQLRKNGGVTTGNFLSTIDFPNVGLYGVTGELVRVGDDSYMYKLNVYDPIAQRSIPVDLPGDNKYISSKAIANGMVNLTDDAIFEAINGKAPTKGDKDLLKQASKNPY